MKLIQVVLVMLLFSVSSHLMSLDIGDKAPGFTLEATDGKTYSLDQFLNKEAVVIAWYPKAFTTGCTIECKSLALNGHLLKDLEVAYQLSVSWVSWIQANSDDWNAIGQLGRVKALMMKLIDLDETWDAGGPHLYMGALETLFPAAMGGRPEKGKYHLEI